MILPTSIDLSIIIPAKNEAENLPTLLEDILTTMNPLHYCFEVVVVNDGSSDSSWEVIKRYHALYPNLIKGIDLHKSVGQSFAMIQGALKAKGTNLIFLDADGQNPPAEIPKLLEATITTPCVFGIRRKRRDNVNKRWISYFANRIRQWLIQDGVQDTGCSLKKIPRELFLSLPRFHGMHRFLPALIQFQGVAFSQCLVEHLPRMQGTSHYHFLNRSWNVVRDLWGVLWLKKRQRSASTRRELL